MPLEPDQGKKTVTMNKLLIGIAMSLGSVAVVTMSTATFAGNPKASAEMRLCSNPDVVIGHAELKEKKSDQGVKLVEIKMKVKGLTPGSHGVHIHETANCQPCGAAGGHFDPGDFGFTSPDGNHPFHLGDLVNIEAKRNGKAKLKTETTRVSVSSGELSLFDLDGSAFIIHDNEDTFCPKRADGTVAPGCAGGSRFACGIIKKKS